CLDVVGHGEEQVDASSRNGSAGESLPSISRQPANRADKLPAQAVRKIIQLPVVHQSSSRVAQIPSKLGGTSTSAKSRNQVGQDIAVADELPLKMPGSAAL